MFKRIIKGDYEYLTKKRNRVILYTILLFALSLSVFFIGIITTGTKRNLLTVVAVLGMLPACKSAVSMIMYIRAKGCSEEVYEMTQKSSTNLISMYDMYFTSYQKNFAISHMIVKDNVIIGLTEDIKCDINACITHLSTMLSQGGHKNTTITITDNKEKYISMLENLNSASKTENEEKDDEIRIALYEISL